MNSFYFGRQYFTTHTYIEVVCVGDVVEYWCGNDFYGIKSMCFGIPISKVDLNDLYNFDFDDYLDNFIEEYLDNYEFV